MDPSQKEFKIGGIQVRCLVTSFTSEGHLETFEASSMAENVGPEMHLHRVREEFFYVIEGEVLFTIGEIVTLGKPGDSFLVPKNTPHQWKFHGNGMHKLLFTFFPSTNQIDYFKTLETMTNQGYAYHDILKMSEEKYDNIAVPVKKDVTTDQKPY